MTTSFSDKTEVFADLYFNFQQEDATPKALVFREIKSFISNVFNQPSLEGMVDYYCDTIVGRVQVSEHFNRDKYAKRIESNLDPLFRFYQELDITERKVFLAMLTELTKINLKLNDVLNRLDAMQIAFLLRENEYDIYVPRLIDNFIFLSTEKKTKGFLYKSLAIEKRKLNSMGRWGDKADIEFDEHGSSAEDGFTSIHIIRRKSRKVSLEKRLDWGAAQILDIRSKFLEKYSGLYKTLSQ
ncbi:MAG: hypothetical protein ACEQSL_02880 [Sediminibacterium sp.]